MADTEPGVVYVGTEMGDETGNGRPADDGNMSDSMIDLVPDRQVRPSWYLEAWPVTRFYAWFMTRFPYVVILAVVVLMVPLAAVSWIHYPPPDYAHEDLTKGFETRGTALRKASTTSRGIYAEVQKGEKYTLHPNISVALARLGLNSSEVLPFFGFTDGLGQRRRRRRALDEPESGHTLGKDHELTPECSNSTLAGMRDDLKFVFESSKGEDLFTAKSLRGICMAEREYVLPYIDATCPMMSISMYITLLSDKPDCLDITEADVAFARDLLEICAGHYHDGTLTQRMQITHAESLGIPHECVQGDYIYNMLHHFADVDFYGKDNPTTGRLRYSLAYLRPTPTPYFDEQDFYMAHINEKSLDNGVVKITALGLVDQDSAKFYLFGEYLLIDLKYFGLAAALILILMILYLQSISLVLATVTNLLFSFVLAYFIYFAVFRLEFFPFLNVLALLILIAVGADDVFVFYDSWQQAKDSEKGQPLEVVTAKTFSHAALSIFVTSLTTSAAFYTNYVSHISAVCCFGVFAGTAILSNFFFMVTWTPAIIVLTDRIWTWISNRVIPERSAAVLSVSRLWARVNEGLGRVQRALLTAACTLVGKAWFVWIPMCVIVGVSACVVVFVTPRLRLPVTNDIQLFPASNPLENWDLNMQDRFQGIIEEAYSDARNMPALFIWGFQPRDDGSKMNPDDTRADLVERPDFSLYQPESQQWLHNFCQDLLNQTWLPAGNRKDTMCTLDAYSLVLNLTCSMDSSGILEPYKEQCCKVRQPPFGAEQLELCAPAIELILYAVNVPKSTLHSNDALKPLKDVLLFEYPAFDERNVITGLLMKLKTTYKMSFSYEVMGEQYHAITGFLNKHLDVAPPGMKQAFFSDDFQLTFYDLQNAIASGTYYSIGLSLIVAFVVMLVTSRNLLITLYAIVTIAFAIAGTVASIVLLGWRLNIVESVTISLAVGLSIDFTIHYGMAYRMSPAKDSRSRVNESFARVGGAVAMAALTTFVAGAAVIPCHVLPYTKLGIFLMLCMSFSWVYATFFFQSICRIIGPRGNFCQIPLICDRIEACKTQRSTTNSHSMASIDSDDSFLVTF